MGADGDAAVGPSSADAKLDRVDSMASGRVASTPLSCTASFDSVPDAIWLARQRRRRRYRSWVAIGIGAVLVLAAVLTTREARVEPEYAAVTSARLEAVPTTCGDSLRVVLTDQQPRDAAAALARRSPLAVVSHTKTDWAYWRGMNGRLAVYVDQADQRGSDARFIGEDGNWLDVVAVSHVDC